MLNLKSNHFQLTFPLLFSIVFGLMLIYLIGFLTFVPYPGFDFNLQTGTHIKVFDPGQIDIFQADDVITKINGITLESYRKNLLAKLWDGISIGDLVEIRIIRNGEPETVLWKFTGQTDAEVDHRLMTDWPQGFGFFLLSLGFYLSLDPANPLRKSMSVASLLAGLWFILTIGPVIKHLWFSPYLATLLGWMIIPLLLQIHLRFPTSFNKNTQRIERYGLPILWILCGIGFLLDLQFPGRQFHNGGLIFSIILSLVLLVVHYSYQKENRDAIHLMTRFFSVALLPTFILAALKGFGLELDNHAQFAVHFAHPLIPTSYLFALWHGKITRGSKLASRFLAAYIFITIIIIISLSIVDILELTQMEFGAIQIISLITVIGLISSLGFNSFQQVVEKYLIGVSVELPEILQSYKDIILTTHDTASISSIMGSLILPSLNIRQSVLVEIQSEQVIRVLDMRGVLGDQIPNVEELQHLLKLNKTILPPLQSRFLAAQKRWVRVILPLRFDQELIGVWLLGRRDPNDYYEEHIVQALELVAQQTTMAIINHQKSNRLRSLYEANINRNEAERASLARELHDDALNNLALLQREFSDPKLSGSLHAIITSLRKTIQGLRPEMLSYGLITALQDLADTLNERNECPRVKVDLQGEPIALDRNTELHIFRIVQQACENAVEHAKAKTISIQGNISKDNIQLRVMDDGIGMVKDMPLNLTALIQSQHYGLAGMFERANIINAKLKLDSTPGNGTSVILNWSRQD